MTTTKRSGTPAGAISSGTARDLVHVDHGQPMTTSRRVAQRFGKRHDNVLRSIRTLCEDLPPGFARLNFEETTSTDEQGRKQPEYLLTQDGFLALAMGFTGKEAAALRASFIEAFDVILMARGADYETRKAELRALVLQQQPARPELADDAPAALPLHPSGTA